MLTLAAVALGACLLARSGVPEDGRFLLVLPLAVLLVAVSMLQVKVNSSLYVSLDYSVLFAVVLLMAPLFATYALVIRLVRWRWRVEGRLLHTEASLAEAQRIAHVGSWTWTVSSGDMHWSDETYRILGYEPQACAPTREGYQGRAHPNDLPHVREALDRALRSGEAFSVDHRVVRPDGSERFVHSQGELIAGSDPPRVLGTVHDITERKALEALLAHRASHDALTGLPNRALFTDRLEQSLLRAQRVEQNVAVLFLDLNGFKHVNDTLGHDAGDELLRAVGTRLGPCLRPHDTLARLGGDEFTLLLDGVDEEGAILVAERIAAGLRTPFIVEGQEFRISASIGIALGMAGKNHAGELLRMADLAMYEAKRAGKGLYQLYETGEVPTVKIVA